MSGLTHSNILTYFGDIGANVGVFSLYAAMKGHSVQAFEPSPGNYYILCKNIEINKLDKNISAYCLAFNDVTKLDMFFMQNTKLGGALSTFGEETDGFGKPFTASFRQSMIGFSIDKIYKPIQTSIPKSHKDRC